ncbi:sensor histidine kinase [Pseudoalteromonas fenneropenaei]|uniref:histidine kinase n=1 Tax=Pseudoalteromonas fenneropenaei TaxID=1737459 RepID=A0ABV7CG93_9GAMM
MADIDYQAAFIRERRARDELEQLFEDQTRALFDANLALQEKIATLERQKALVLKTEKMATLGSLAAGVAHEINNPLAYVSSNIECLQDYSQALIDMSTLVSDLDSEGQLPPELLPLAAKLQTKYDVSAMTFEIKEMLDDVSDGVKRISGIVNNLLSFSRPRESQFEHVDVCSLIAKVVRLLESQFKYVNLVSHTQAVPLTYCNGDALGQAIINVLLNAKEACEQRQERDGVVHIYLCESQDMIVIKVTDNGCGMTEETMTRAFEPFFTTKPVGQGTGMGLAVVYGVIADHQGSVDIDSKLQTGTVITIKIPVSHTPPVYR